MKTPTRSLMVSVLGITLLLPVATQANGSGRAVGGAPAFFIGCCFGLREGTMWNEGADLHWREWSTIIPVVGGLVAIWNGIECAQGLTSRQFVEQFGVNWY